MQWMFLSPFIANFDAGELHQILPAPATPGGARGHLQGGITAQHATVYYYGDWTIVRVVPGELC